MPVAEITPNTIVTAEGWWNPLTRQGNTTESGLSTEISNRQAGDTAINNRLNSTVFNGGISDLSSRLTAVENSASSSATAVNNLNTAVGMPYASGTSLSSRVTSLEANGSPNAPKGVIARHVRLTSSAVATTAAIGVVRIDGIPVTNGRAYKITTNNLIIISSVAGDDISVELTFATGGTQATTTSANLPGSTIQDRMQSTANGLTGQILAWHYPTATTTLSLLLRLTRKAGSGNVTLYAETGKYVIGLQVEDCGVAPANSGANI